MIYEVLLEGLNCGSCASKIQSEITGLEEVLDAKVNIATSSISIELDGDVDFRGVLSRLKSIVKRIEPHVKVVYHDESSEESYLEEENDEKRFKVKRIAFGAILFAISFLIPEATNVRIGVLTFSYLFVGADIVERSFRNILSGDVFDENFLMTIATFGAILIGEYPEAVAVMLFYQVGESFQDRAVDKSRKSIKALLDIRPDSAKVKRDGEILSVSPDEVAVGETIVVRPGEKIPLDGTVISGETRVNTSALTGESVPRKLRVGDEALSGFLNETGLVEIEVRKPFGESTVSKILDLVQNASSKKAPTENFITKFARYYTPAVVGLAGIIAFIVPVLIGEPFSTWIYRSLVFLVISCPCALVVSIPLGFFGGIGASSKSGILIKGGNYLEALNDVDCIVMDKTGTLTEGVFEVQSISAFNGFTEDEVLDLSAIAEVHTNHPIGKSIVEKYGKRPDESRIEKYEEVSGHGISSTIDGRQVIVGNEKLMKLNGVDYINDKEGGTVVLTAVDGVFAGRIYIADKIKSDAVDAIAKLKKRGISEIVMLTGDSESVAKIIAEQLGIDTYYSELLPEDKVDKLEEISLRRAGKGKIVFVGDGINDAPVLARADIGISMGGLGSDAAIEASDIVIMTDEPSKISKALDIAKRTKQIVVQNIVLALGVKAIVLGLGTVGLAGMWEAVFADVGVSLIAILNSIRVLKMK